MSLISTEWIRPRAAIGTSQSTLSTCHDFVRGEGGERSEAKAARREYEREGRPLARTVGLPPDRRSRNRPGGLGKRGAAAPVARSGMCPVSLGPLGPVGLLGSRGVAAPCFGWWFSP
jgi:hypothetical protein